MQKMDSQTVNLNLLRTLAALLEERSVSAAARRLHLSQPATSRALAQLRDAFGDALLVRSGRSMVATPLAQKLGGPLREVQDAIGRLFDSRPFSPRTLRRRWSIASTDYASILVLPQWVESVRRDARGMDFRISNWDHLVGENLAKGNLDFAVGAVPSQQSGIYRRKLFTDTYVCVAARSQKALRRNMEVAEFAALPHGFITVTGLGPGVVDDALLSRGLRRRVVVSLPHFSAAALLACHSDLVLTMPRRIFASLRTPALPLKAVPPPLDLPSIDICLLWHERQQNDEAHVWLRNRL